MNNDITVGKQDVSDLSVPSEMTRGFGARGWTIIVFQAIMFWLAAGAVTHGLNVMLPALSKTFNLDYNALLALATPASWVSILGAPFAAWLMEKKGAKFNIVFSLLACGLCFGLLGHWGTLTGFTILFSGVCLFGTAFAYIGGTALMASWFVRQNGMALGWCTLGQTFSSCLFVPALATSFAVFGVQYGFWGIAIPMFIMAVLVLLFVKNKPEDVGMAPDNMPLSSKLNTRVEVDEESSNISMKTLLGMKDIWLMGVATGAIYIMLVGVVSQIVPRLMAMGYELQTAIFYMSASALFGIIGAYVWGKLNEKMGVKTALLIYTAWWMVSIVLNLYATNEYLLWASLFMIGVSLPGATNLSTALVATKFPRKLYIRAIAIVHPIQSVIRCLAFSILAFGLAYLGGYPGAYSLLVGVGVITLILLWLIDTTPVDEAALTKK